MMPHTYRHKMERFRLAANAAIFIGLKHVKLGLIVGPDAEVIRCAAHIRNVTRYGKLSLFAKGVQRRREKRAAERSEA